MANLVAGRVLAMLGELDGKALERAAMHAGEKALDDLPGQQRQAAVLAQLGGVEAEHGGFIGERRRVSVTMMR